MQFTINRTLFIEKLEKASATVDVKTQCRHYKVFYWIVIQRE